MYVYLKLGNSNDTLIKDSREFMRPCKYQFNLTKCSLIKICVFSVCYSRVYMYMWPNLQKLRGLIHISNFSTLRLCNYVCVWPTVLKFGSKTILLLHLYDKTFQLNNSLIIINKVMPLQSCTIRCMYKTPFHKSGHKY